MSLISFLMPLGSMSHVDFKKRPCRHVKFRGQGPSEWSGRELLIAGTLPSEQLTDSAFVLLVNINQSQPDT